MSNICKLLEDMRGASFLGLDTEVKVALRGGKKNPFQNRVTKRHNGASVMLFSNTNSNGYANMVARRLAAEGKDPASFELGPRVWGKRVEGFPIVEHTNKEGILKHYLEVIYLRPGTSVYYVDGVETAKDLIEGIPVVAASEEGQGGLSEENRVQIRSYDLASLVQMRINQLNVVGPFFFKP